MKRKKKKINYYYGKKGKGILFFPNILGGYKKIRY